ncbi:MAG: beta-glucuronidase [Lachnospiraceae bacterium]|jgi:beta-glucuronidase|nr:beta-glucuronidase [Lachnospiraceae bacterium]
MISMLYPKMTRTRKVIDLDGMWKVYFDFENQGEDFSKGIPGKDYIPVPSSFADLYTEKKYREFCGDIWYETEFVIPEEWKGQRLEIRFAGAAHRATVYFNGRQVTEHEGGFTPFGADVSETAIYGEKNLLVVKVNTELRATSLPNGETKQLKNGTLMAIPYFDFYNYTGIQRSVKLVVTPFTRIADYDLTYEITGNDAAVNYRALVQNLKENQEVELEIRDEEDKKAASVKGESGRAEIANVRLWQVRDAYLYRFIWRVWEDGKLVDEYEEPIGVRTVEISGTDILVNGKPVYLKGFGRHEDSPVNGKTFAPCYLKRDFELMKWMGANSFRTSHYPYAEETYQEADREGFLVIDEVPAVGFVKRSGMAMFQNAGSGVKPTSFFAADTTQELLENHVNVLKELVQRDKNHACVIAWSLFNEPESISEEASAYFKVVFDKAREFDPQKRPRTFAMELSSGPDAKCCHQYCDFWTMNRYYGWYVKGGYEISDAMIAFRKEMDEWASQDPVKPMVFTEYGADTLSSEHKLPSVMWSQEYQLEYLELYHELFDSYPFVKGEQVWNFADFQTVEGIGRVNGNKKGIFTRDRQPKDSAYLIKKRWEELPLDYKGGK